MASFSPSDAAFEGFRLTRERPRAVAIWAVLYVLVGLVSGIIMVLTVGPQFAAVQAAAQSPSQDPAAALAQFRQLAPYYALMLPIGLVVQAALTCAIYRAVLRPQESSFGYLRLGGDEFRIIILAILLWLLAFVGVFAFIMVTAILAGLIGVAGGAAAGLAGVLFAIGGLGAAVWIAVRLSLAAPMTFATGEIHIFRSWGLTRGQFWPLLGCCILAVVLALVVFLAALVIFSAIAGSYMVMTGGSINGLVRMFAPDTSSLATYFHPMQLLYQLFSSALIAVVYALILSPPAVAYAALSGNPVTHKS